MTNRMYFASVAALFAGLSTAGCGDAESINASCGTYAKEPENTSGVVYVSAACGARDGDGSAKRPFGSIQQGIDASVEGGAVLVDAGTYAENVSITKAVEVLGADEAGDPNNASIIVQAPSPYAITVEGATGVRLRGIIVQKPQGAGIWVQKAGAAVIEGSRIEGATVAEVDGHGVMATDKGSIIVQRTIIVQSEGAGIHVSSAAAKVERSIIVQSGRFGGIWVQSAVGEVSISENEISENTDSGISILGSRAIIVQNQVKHTKGRGGATSADGIRVLGDMTLGEAYARIGGKTPEEGNIIEGNDRVGIFVSGALTRGIIVQNEVLGNGDATTRGAGIWVQSLAGTSEMPDENVAIQIEQNRIEGNHFLGIGVTSGSRAIIVQNPSISGTIAGEIAANGSMIKIGDGLGVYNGAFGHVDNNKLTGNARAGAVFDGSANTCVVTNNTVLDNATASIIVQNQNPLDLVSNEFDDKGPNGALAVDSSEM